jgi:excisionase family DNA binding protein
MTTYPMQASENHPKPVDWKDHSRVPVPTQLPNTRDAHQGRTAARVTYTVPEIAELMGLSRASVYVLLRAGEIPALRMGGRWIIPRRRFHAWLDGEAVGQ